MKHRRRPPVRTRHPDPLPPDRSWAARATALRQERPAQWAMLAAIASALTTLAGWIAVLIAPGGDLRFHPVFWLLALPLMPWIWGLQAQAAWAVKTLWAALLLWPGLALAALFTAPGLRDAGVPGGSLATPMAMAIVLALSTAFAAAGAVALRRSSLPGGTRPVAFLPPGTPLPGIRPLSSAASVMLMQGSVPVSAALINGSFAAIVATLDPLGPAGTVWPVALQATGVLGVGALVFRGGFRLARRQPGAAQDLRRGWIAGVVWAAVAIATLWAWPTLPTAKLAFSAFMVPVALAAAWCSRLALRALPGAAEASRAEPTGRPA